MTVSVPQLRKVPIAPADLLTAASTIRLHEANCHSWLQKAWVGAAEYLDWANRGLIVGGDDGFATAVTFAKRAVCRRIDALLIYNHLRQYQRAAYPAKLEVLAATGISSPQIVYELNISPRNQMEHGYERVSLTVARHAVEIADLYLRSTAAEEERGAIIALDWNILGGLTASTTGGLRVHVGPFADRPMLFVDVFANPVAAKIVNPLRSEVLVAEIGSFTPDENQQLARLLRRHWDEPSRGERSLPPEYYQEAKRALGF